MVKFSSKIYLGVVIDDINNKNEKKPRQNPDDLKGYLKTNKNVQGYSI